MGGSQRTDDRGRVAVVVAQQRLATAIGGGEGDDRIRAFVPLDLEIGGRAVGGEAERELDVATGGLVVELAPAAAYVAVVELVVVVPVMP